MNRAQALPSRVGWGLCGGGHDAEGEVAASFRSVGCVRVGGRVEGRKATVSSSPLLPLIMSLTDKPTVAPRMSPSLPCTLEA